MKPQPSQPASWLARVMSFFFHHLYHTFADLYDLVAYVVSLGQWQSWVTGIRPYLQGPRILEIGFGPGHLQEALSQSGTDLVFGLDESRQMARLAAKRLQRIQTWLPRIVRGRAESLPFPPEYFNTVVATFPTPYIAQPETVAQITRVLVPGGRLVVLLAARHPRDTLLVKAADGLFAITGQAPPSPANSSRITQPFAQTGLEPVLRWENTPHGKLLVLIANKTQK